MSTIFDMIMGSASTIIPIILAIGAGLFAMLKGSQLKNEKIKSGLINQKANGEKERADIAERAIQIISDKNIETKKEIKIAIKKAKLDRIDFFN